MRTVTVDTRGLWFTFKLATLAIAIGGAWSVWGPFTDEVQTVLDDPNLALASNVGESTTAPSEARIPLPEEGRFIHLDALSKQVVLYDGTTKDASFPIFHIPSSASSDALVRGAYSITLKRASELSTVTMVRFPDYVAFGEGYAFHGTPTDTDGVAMPRDYAGASILLSDDDAFALSAYAVEGMQVYVDAPDRDTTERDLVALLGGALPATSALSYALVDMDTGQVYLAKNERARYPIASITKLITASVASEIIGHGTELTAQNGEHYTLGDLFYPLLLRSDNTIAQRIAAYVGTSAFITHMNAYVRAHGMEQTSFADSSGLSPRNLSTSYDLALFAKHLYDEKEYLLSMAGEDSVTITSVEGHDRTIVNQNKFADDPYFRGGKLGYTDEAMQTSLALFNLPAGDTTRPVAVIILGSQDWKQDTRTLLRWLSKSLDG